MKNIIDKAIKIFTQRLITQVIIVLIISAIFCVSCIQIYDRCTFHNYVKETAKEYVDSVSKKRLAALQDDASFYAQDSIIAITSNAEESISLNNINYNKSSELNTHLQVQDIFDILSKSDGILSANGITFLVTLVVALLVTLLVHRMDSEQRWRESFGKEMKKQTIEMQNSVTKSIIIHTAKFNNILTRVASIYNLGTMIDDVAKTLSSEKSEMTNRSLKIGKLCSRLSLTCSELDSRLKNKKQKLEFLTKDEKEILYTYLTDTLDDLKSSQDYADRLGIKALNNIIEKKIDVVEEIKDTLDSVEIREGIM